MASFAYRSKNMWKLFSSDNCASRIIWSFMFTRPSASSSRILICRQFYKLLKQVAAVSEVERWILFQYLIVFVPGPTLLFIPDI